MQVIRSLSRWPVRERYDVTVLVNGLPLACGVEKRGGDS